MLASFNSVTVACKNLTVSYSVTFTSANAAETRTVVNNNIANLLRLLCGNLLCNDAIAIYQG